MQKEIEAFRNVDLAAHQYIECASMLPNSAFKKKEKEDSNFHFLTLKSYGRRKAPEWDVVGRLCNSLNNLLGHTNGLNVQPEKLLGCIVWMGSESIFRKMFRGSCVLSPNSHRANAMA